LQPTYLPALDASADGSFVYTHIGYIFFYSQVLHVLDGVTVYRAHGLAWEPGIFQFFCNYLIVYGCANKGDSRSKLLILIGAIGVLISTSTMGFLIAVIVLAIAVRRSSLMLGVPLLGIAVLAVVIFTSKFQLGTQESMSTIIRMIDVEVPLRYMLKYPLFGIGNDSTVVSKLGVDSLILDYMLANVPSGFLNNYMDNLFNTNAIFNTSNGLLSLGMQYGLVALGFYLLGLYRLCRQVQMPGFFVLIVLTLLNEPVALTLLFLLFSALGLIAVADARVPDKRHQWP
jgi:hypothetical protein